MEWGLGLNQHTRVAIGQPWFVPQPPNFPSQKSGTEVKRGWRGQNRKIHWGIFPKMSPKMMILQGVKHRISYIEVCYANIPPNGGGLSRLHLI